MPERDGKVHGVAECCSIKLSVLSNHAICMIIYDSN